MWNAWGVVTSGMIVLLTPLAVFSAQSEMDTKSARLFKTQWTSIRYLKTATVDNPEVYAATRQKPAGIQMEERLSLSGQIEILDLDRILATAREGVITRVVDSAGQDVNIPSVPSPPHRFYESPRYSPRFSRPPQVPGWQAFLRKVFRLPPPNAGFRPQRIEVLQPNSLDLKLDLKLLHNKGSEIRRVTGYFYAVVPASLETIDVPFEPNNTWVRVTPDLEIQVQEATCSGSTYRYSFATRGDGMIPSPSRSPAPHLADPLPHRLIKAHQLIGRDGKPMSAASGGGGSSSNGGIGQASGSGGGLTGPVKAFRFIIAVDPSERKIPFEFEHVPLPQP